MKLTEIINARNVIMQHTQDKIKAKLAYSFMKFLKATDNDEVFFRQREREIIEKYCLRDENNELINNNGAFSIDPEKMEECSKEVNELNNIDTEDCTITFNINDLETLQLSTEEISSLYPFIQE